ncbi:ClpP/crotonase [Aspergillus sclerotioniger CBS 115572]|uniref:ClpP/crotonase n=1 Tax=Aspergillus sclerotioniger CBS 115572 TaxID=1450535 RepID=A0A317WDX5_9EURO|nr:ClpP/crotonase [Aspergillus sclerotioniger CBS 115572]PWY84666.1 ClpP/crotonase [Aspergillus sclerotioniger CBS 115572]
MFARQCSRLVSSRTAIPLTSYLARGRQFSATATSAYEHILTSTPKPGVGLITLNRPKALNALSSPLFEELNDALTTYDTDKDIGAIIITGSEKAFAAGADIKEMAPLTFSSAYSNNFIAPWSHLANTIRKPVIAAVSGYALGGGCELALMCDIIYCTATATFGQPEIKLGVIPGAGGSQRLTKAREGGGRVGVAAEVVEGGKDKVLEKAVQTAETIAGYSRVAVVAGKEVVNKSYEIGLKEGVEFERRLFHGLFGSKDQKIGMTAFAEKKKPEWSNE